MKLNFDFVDKSFRPAESANYRLSIQISLNGFSLCIYDISKNRHIVLRSFEYADGKDLRNEIAGILDGIAGFNSEIIPVKILYINRKNMIIPANVFDKNKAGEYLSFWFQIDEDEEISIQYMPGIEAFICYIIPSWLVMKLQARFKNIKIYNQTYYNIRQIYRESHDTKSKLIFSENIIDLTIFKNNALILNNTFEIANIQDAIYFVMAATKKTDTANAPVYVSGDISIGDLDKLKCYLPHIQHNHDKKMTLRLGRETSSKYYSLLLLHECE